MTTSPLNPEEQRNIRRREEARREATSDPREEPCEGCGNELDECICMDEAVLDRLSGDLNYL
jgi:hypothetical protein